MEHPFQIVSFKSNVCEKLYISLMTDHIKCLRTSGIIAGGCDEGAGEGRVQIQHNEGGRLTWGRDAGSWVSVTSFSANYQPFTNTLTMTFRGHAWD